MGTSPASWLSAANLAKAWAFAERHAGVVLHRAAPLLDLREVERAEFGRRAACGIDALLVELLAHFRVGHRGADFRAEPLDDGLGSAASGEHAVPGKYLVAGNALLRDRRQIRQAANPFARGRGDDADFPRLRQRQRGRQRRNDHVHLAAHDIGQCLRVALVRDVHQIDPGHRLEQLAAEMQRGAVAR